MPAMPLPPPPIPSIPSPSIPNSNSNSSTPNQSPVAQQNSNSKAQPNLAIFGLENIQRALETIPEEFDQEPVTHVVIPMPANPPERDPIPVFEPAAEIHNLTSDLDQLFTREEISRISAAHARAGRWAKLPDRFDPFDQLYLTNMLRTNFYSDKLDAPVMDLDGALIHACAIVAQWRAEDQLIAAERRKIQNREAQQRFRKKVNSDPEIAAAEKAYRDALDQRRVAIEQWDDHIRALKEAIAHAKSSYEKRQSSRI